MLNDQQVEPVDEPGEPTNAQVMAELRQMRGFQRAMNDKLDQVLSRAEPLLKLAEGWARLKGFGRG